MRKIKLVWSSEAKRDLKSIKEYISRDKPQTARSFVKKLKDHARKLETSPELGAVLEEAKHLNLREIVVGNYRIIYKYDGNTVRIVTVCHGARLLGHDILESE
jgi:addiction module RelE/StbE family toxin